MDKSGFESQVFYEDATKSQGKMAPLKRISLHGWVDKESKEYTITVYRRKLCKIHSCCQFNFARLKKSTDLESRKIQKH